MLAGSCALVAHIRGVNLHVANAGDSAAVLGLYSQGVASAMPLSKSHCVDNADEVSLFFYIFNVKLGIKRGECFRWILRKMKISH